MNVIPLWVCQEGCAFRDHVCHKVRQTGIKVRDTSPVTVGAAGADKLDPNQKNDSW